MTTPRFKRLASPTALAMDAAYHRVKDGETLARIPCTAPRCTGTIEFSGNTRTPHRTAGSCSVPGCIRWAVQ